MGSQWILASLAYTISSGYPACPAPAAMAISSVPSLVEQTMMEVILQNLVTTDLPYHLKRDVEGVQRLEGDFLVTGYETKVRRRGSGRVSVEEQKQCCAAVDTAMGNKKLLKVGRLLKVRRIGETLNIRWWLNNIRVRKVILLLDRKHQNGHAVKLERGGLVRYDGLEVRGDGEGGISLILPTDSGLVDCLMTVTYKTTRITDM